MTDQQKDLFECYKVAAEYCGRTNEGGKQIYGTHDLHNIAFSIAQNIGIMKYNG